MTQPVTGSRSVWPLIAVLGVATFALRLSFIQFSGVVDEFPPAARRALTFVPAAILAALVAPELVAVDGSLVGAVLNPRAIAGAVGAVVAWRTDDMMATIAVGMAALWVARFLAG
ncbi:MAG: AzlD domain-containing protein [Halosimplex sp.]